MADSFPRPSDLDGFVSKSDAMRYRHCPYGFWARDSGLVKEADYLGDGAVGRIEAGIAFERTVSEDVPVDSRPLEEIFLGRVRLFQPPPIANDELRLVGMPDAIDTGAGALIPIEVKLHRRPGADDRIELAFYWLLLAPYRTAPSGSPIGRLLTPAGEHELKLTARHFAEVSRLVQGVRDARRYGVEPRPCKCEICAGPMAPVIADFLDGGDDLTNIRGIGRSYVVALEQAGVHDLAALAAADPDVLATSVVAHGRRPGSAAITRWQRSAESLTSKRMIRDPNEPPLPERGIAVDFEYHSEADSHIWLIGAMVIGANESEGQTLSLWAESPEAEHENLKRLEELLAAHVGLPVITWNGRSAERVALRYAAARWGTSDLYDEFVRREFDLLRHIDLYMALPVPRFSLSEVSRYFGHKEQGEVSDGEDAVARYQAILSMPLGPERSAAVAELQDYNANDLTAVGVVIRALRS